MQEHATIQLSRSEQVAFVSAFVRPDEALGSPAARGCDLSPTAGAVIARG
jgi:hypothetical protein